MQTQKEEKNRRSSVSIFSSKIKCGECESFYGSKVWHSNDKYRRVVWRCNHKFDNDRKCKTPHLDEDAIKQIFVSAMNKLITNKSQILSDFKLIRSVLSDTGKINEAINSRREKMELFIKNLKKQSGVVTEFDESLWLSLVEYVMVNSKEDIRVTFKNGTEIQV